MSEQLPCKILSVICSGLYVVIEEGDPEKPVTMRTYVESAENIVTLARYRKAWEMFAG